MARHLNARHRGAKLAGRASCEYFLYEYIAGLSSPVQTRGIVKKILRNGLLAFIPRFGIALPIYFTDADGKPVYDCDLVFEEGTHISVELDAKVSEALATNSLTVRYISHAVDEEEQRNDDSKAKDEKKEGPLAPTKPSASPKQIPTSSEEFLPLRSSSLYMRLCSE